VFADQHEDKLRYCFELGRWFHWDGTVWTPDAEAHLDELAELSVMSFPGEASELMDARTREEFMKWAIRSGSRQRMKAMQEQSRHRLIIEKEKLDHNPMSFNLFAESVNFENGKVGSSDPKDFSTMDSKGVPEWA
jgi:phage/plasmid-associated DNA primase